MFSGKLAIKYPLKSATVPRKLVSKKFAWEIFRRGRKVKHKFESKFMRVSHLLETIFRKFTRDCMTVNNEFSIIYLSTYCNYSKSRKL